MHRIMGPDRYLADGFRYLHPGQAPGKWLLSNMRMVKGSSPKDRTVRRHNIPLVGVVFPTFIIVPHGNMKVIGFFV